MITQNVVNKISRFKFYCGYILIIYDILVEVIRFVKTIAAFLSSIIKCLRD